MLIASTGIALLIGAVFGKIAADIYYAQLIEDKDAEIEQYKQLLGEL